MTRVGAARLRVTVVPDSGPDPLVGLTGAMTIQITDGKHSYNFEYTLAGTPQRMADLNSESAELPFL